MWDLRTGSVARTLETKAPVTSVEVSHCGRYLVTGGGHEVEVRDAATFDLLKAHTVKEYEVESASYAPEKRR